MDAMSAVEVFAPAKINLFLGVTGLRKDGFHSLVSCVAPLAFGDTLRIEILECGNTDAFLAEGWEVDCVLSDNLAWKALLAFRSLVPELPPVRISLVKRIPLGAGLGGGSSDAVAVLWGLNHLSGGVLNGVELHDLAASLGSDCPLFLPRKPSVIRGRGELVEPMSPHDSAFFQEVRLILFKPFLNLNTAWAYGRLKEQRCYLSPSEAEAHLRGCIDSWCALRFQFYNTFESVVFEKILGLGLLIKQLRAEGIACAMSGSGSACFSIVRTDAEANHVRNRVNSSWGEDAFIVETRLLNEY